MTTPNINPSNQIPLAQHVPSASEAASVYEEVGGDEAFRRLVDLFYARIEADPLLRPMFPADLGPGKERQFLFLTQFFGGPPRYNERRGHPRLRARHLPVPIGTREAERWLGHMLAAVDEAGIPEPARTKMRNYFDYAAHFLINQAETPSSA
jgi:hemoglobin